MFVFLTWMFPLHFFFFFHVSCPKHECEICRCCSHLVLRGDNLRINANMQGMVRQGGRMRLGLQ